MLSIVVPVFNEEESLGAFYSELIKELPKKEHEIVFVDDGSTDKSFFILQDFAKKNKNVKIFSFRKNHGKAEALTLGFQKALGDFIVTLDADLQDKPSEIENFLKKLNEGYDVVCGWRENRRDDLKKKLSSRVFNTIAGSVWGLHLHDYNCGFKAYTRNAAKSLNLYGGLHRFIPLLAFQKGFSVTEISVQHDKRKFGKSKYGFSKVWKDLPDMFTMLFLTKYKVRPLHFFGVIGTMLFFSGSLILLYLLWVKLMGHAISGRPILFLGMILLLSGLQTFLTGFLADLINSSAKRDADSDLKYSS